MTIQRDPSWTVGLGIIGALVVTLIIAIGTVFWTKPAHAQSEPTKNAGMAATIPTQQGTIKLTIYEDDCTDEALLGFTEKVLAQIEERGFPVERPARRSRLFWLDGKTYESCWIINPMNGNIFSVDTKNEWLLPGVPIQLFKPVESI
jgi:hypothetical protein